MKTSISTLCDVKNSILVIIDVQTKLGEAMPKKVLNRVVENTVLLIKSANLLKVPVIATAQYPKGLGQFIDVIDNELSESTQQIEKTCFSCCGANNFLESIEKSGCKQVILTGMEAHVCVLQTAVELHEQGYEVFTVGDAICSRRLDNYQNSLERLNLLGAHQTNTESVVFEWLRDAKHEHFKQIAGWLR